jgi:hypothetical protein
MTIPKIDHYIPLLQWLGIISLLTFIISILLIPFLVGLLPPDYFIRGKKPPPDVPPHPALSLFLLLLRHVFGVMLLLAGIAMLFLPGQGILTILLGISLLNFPGKHELVRKLIGQASVQQGLNWIRAKTKRPPFIWLQKP